MGVARDKYGAQALSSSHVIKIEPVIVTAEEAAEQTDQALDDLSKGKITADEGKNVGGCDLPRA